MDSCVGRNEHEIHASVEAISLDTGGRMATKVVDTDELMFKVTFDLRKKAEM